MPPKRNLAAAMARRQGLSVDDQIASLKADKEHAERLAKLAAAASSRGAAPAPPKKGEKPSAPAPAASSAPAKVEKFRAVKDFKGTDVSFTAGATVFVVGEPGPDGKVQGVANGKAGTIDFGCLTPITPELLEKERIQREKELEQARKEDEAALEAEKKKMQEDFAKEHGGSADAGDVAAGGAPLTAEQKEYNAELEKKFEEERAALLAEEERMKAEVAKLEAMMAALDADD